MLYVRHQSTTIYCNYAARLQVAIERTTTKIAAIKSRLAVLRTGWFSPARSAARRARAALRTLLDVCFHQLEYLAAQSVAVNQCALTELGVIV